MAEFPTAVQPPGGASYAPPLMNFSNFSNWATDDPYKLPTEKAKLEQFQNIAGLQKQLQQEFAKGGELDYRKAAGLIAAMGSPAEAMMMLQQQPAPLPQILGGGQPQGGQPQGQPQAQPAPQVAPQGQPASVQARPLPPPGRGPQGDAGTGTVTSLVTDRLPAQNQTTGETIMKIAQVMGIDPNANLTPGQVVRAQGLLKKYAPEIAGSGALSFSDRFRGDSGGDQGGGLPPSANAGTPAATAAPPAQGARPQGGQGAAQGGQPSAQQPQAQAQPLVPQEPLPPGYTDPVKAIADLRLEANRLAADPRPNAQAMAQRADAWAARIEAGLKPVSVGASTTLVDPRTSQPIYQGPAAAAYGSGGGETGATLDADANQYRMTGKLPPNMGRGIQGQQQATAIRTRAAEQEVTEGGDPNDWPTRWQHFATQAAGLRTLETRAAGLTLAENEASTLIPRVREASARVSRTQYPNINSLILAAKKGTGGTDVIKLGVAVESLIPVYAKILKPVGTVGAADMERAHDILEKKWSDGQINAALDQMEVELKSARSALDKTMEEFGTKKKRETTGSDVSKAGSSTSKSSTYQNTTPDGFGWSMEK
jgi:hypothetical protein